MGKIDRILRRLEKEDAEKAQQELDRVKQPGARLMVITACCQCVHSRETSACFHPDTPGREDIDGNPPFNDGSGQPFQCSRPLPPVPPGKGGFPEYQAPPDWCPLPKAAE